MSCEASLTTKWINHSHQKHLLTTVLKYSVQWIQVMLTHKQFWQSLGEGAEYLHHNLGLLGILRFK